MGCVISLAPMNLKDRLAIAMEGPPRVTQASLARACKVSQPSVNDWLSGKSKTIRGATLLAVAKFLAVSPDWLATGKGPMRLNHTGQSSGGASPHVPVSKLGEPLTAEVLAEAEYWVRFEEGSGAVFQPLRRAERLLELCREIAEAGGRLSPQRAAQLMAARAQELQGVGDEGRQLEERRRTKRE